MAPVFTAQGKEIKADLTPADIVTNDFLDPVDRGSGRRRP